MFTLAKYPPAPEPPLVSAARLTPAEKQRVWQHVQQHEPNLAEWFKDPSVARLLKQGATMQFEPDLIEAALGPAARARLLPSPPAARPPAPMRPRRRAYA